MIVKVVFFCGFLFVPRLQIMNFIHGPITEADCLLSRIKHESSV